MVQLIYNYENWEPPICRQRGIHISFQISNLTPMGAWQEWIHWGHFAASPSTFLPSLSHKFDPVISIRLWHEHEYIYIIFIQSVLSLQTVVKVTPKYRNTDRFQDPTWKVMWFWTVLTWSTCRLANHGFHAL